MNISNSSNVGKHTAGSRGKRQVLGVSVEEVVRTKISENRRGRLAVGTKNRDQPICEFGKLWSAADT